MVGHIGRILNLTYRSRIFEIDLLENSGKKIPFGIFHLFFHEKLFPVLSGIFVHRVSRLYSFHCFLSVCFSAFEDFVAPPSRSLYPVILKRNANYVFVQHRQDIETICSLGVPCARVDKSIAY